MPHHTFIPAYLLRTGLLLLFLSALTVLLNNVFFQVDYPAFWMLFSGDAMMILLAVSIQFVMSRGWLHGVLLWATLVLMTCALGVGYYQYDSGNEALGQTANGWVSSGALIVMTVLLLLWLLRSLPQRLYSKYGRLTLVVTSLSAIVILVLWPTNVAWLSFGLHREMHSLAAIMFALLLVNELLSERCEKLPRADFSTANYGYGLLILLSAVAFWFHLHQLESRAVQQKAVQLVEQMFQSSEQELIHTEKLLQRMADRLALLGLENNETYWQLDAAGYFRDVDALKHLAVISEQEGRVFNQGRNNTADSWFYNKILPQTDVQSALLQQKVTKLVLSSSSDQCWLVFLLPFQVNEQSFTLIASMELSILVSKWQHPEPGFQLALTVQRNDGGNAFAPLLPLSDTPQRLYVTDKTLFPDSKWRAKVYRVPELWLNNMVFPPAIVLVFGYVFFFVFMLSQSLLSAASQSRQQLVQSNLQLKRSLSTQSELMALNESIMSNSMDVLTIVNAGGYFIQLSDACEQVFGYQRDELMRQPFLELVHPDDKERTRQEAEKVKQGFETQNFRNRYIHKSGTTVWLMWSARWSDESQTMFAIARDITGMVAQEQIDSIRTTILQQIATNQSLQSILEHICRFYMQHFIGSQCTVMQATEGTLSMFASPDMDPRFVEAMNKQVIGPDSGVSGRAAYYKEKVLVANIEQDASITSFHELAKKYQVKACWSFPLLGNKSAVMGTFVIYYQTEKFPTFAELTLIDACRQLSIVAIERERDRQQVQHSEQRYRSLYISNPDPVFSLDLAGRFTSVNRAGCLLLQTPEEQLLGKYFRDLLVEHEQERVQHFFELTLHGSPQSYELHLRRKDGQALTLQLSHTPIHIDHKIVGVFAIAKDLTEKLHNQENLRLFKRAVESSSNGVVIADVRQPDLPIVFVNKAFERITGYSAAEAIGRNCRFLQGGLRDEAALHEIRRGLQKQADCHVLLENIRKDGTHFWNELFIAPVPDDEGAISHFVGVQNDVTAQKNFEVELAYNASHDILTGLPNRALLHDRLHQCCKMSDRSQRKLAVMFIDLDGFKLVNDTLGHLVGDQLLIDVSKRLTQQIRPGDTLARLGGDEFVVLLPELNHDGDVVLVAERILQHINETFVVEGHELHISASIGLTLSSCQLDDPTVLIQQADVAMYEAKQLGRNNYQWYKHALDKALGRQLALRNELQKALINNEFELHYQPQYDAVSSTIVGVEALIRWNHPTLGMVSPADFIPIAEGSGQIIAISEWVLNTACKFAASIKQKGFHEVVMAVNISSLQFQRSNFVAGIQAVLQKHQLAPESLELEVTESVLLSYADSAIEKLHQLKELGVHISIDDFGTGFSSLSYLKHLPIQKIKIDRSFIRDVIRDRHDAAITKAIISMAHHLQLTVVAEGVETKAQVAFLRKYHCNQFQGFYFAQPMPAEKLESLLRSQQDQEQQGASIFEGESRSKHLLLLDDEENILNALRRVLRRESYSIHLASSAEQAFELLAMHDIQVIVSDQRMPGMSGTEFLSKVKAMYPNTVRLVLSGYTDLKSVTAAINEGAIYKFLTKPWDDKQLREEIRTAFLHQEYLMQDQIDK